MKTEKYNRITAIGATGIFLILSLLVANLSTPKSGDPLAQRPSTFFTDPTGARALFLVMRRLLPAAEQWRRPFYRLPTEGKDGADSLIVADPKIPLGKLELASLDGWIASGGQLVLLGGSRWALRSQADADRAPTEPAPTPDDKPDARAGEKSVAAEVQFDEVATFSSRYAPALRWSKPGRFKVEPASGSSIPAEEIKLGWRRSFAAIGGAKAIAAADNQTLAVEIPLGQGRIVAIADASMMSNSALRRSDNGVWLVNLVASWGNGRVWFDEFHHGFGEKQSAASLAWAFATTPWGWCLGQIAAAGLLYIFCYRRRFGRIAEPLLFERSDPLDQVDARAGIFSAAGAQRLAIQLMLQHLSQELSQIHGRTIDVTGMDERARNRMTTQTARQSLARLQALAAKAERGENLSENEFTEIGRLAGAIGKDEKVGLSTRKRSIVSFDGANFHTSHW